MNHKSYVVRHVHLDEVLTQGGFYPRVRNTARGQVTDDKNGMLFPSEADARAYLQLLGIQHEGHQIVHREIKEEQDFVGGVKSLGTDDFYGLSQ